MTKTHGIIIAIVSLLLVLSLFFATILGITTGVSILEAVLYAMETEEPQEEESGAEEPVESLPVSNTVVLGEKDYFDDLHKLILMTDIDAIPENIRLTQGASDNLVYVTSNGSKSISLKTYLYIYQLLAEICLRPEINPDDTSVKITPMDLIGECIIESGFMNLDNTTTGYDKASSSTGFHSATALYWQTEDDLLEKTRNTAVYEQVAQVLSGVDLGVDYVESYICVGPLAESLLYTFNWDSQNNPKSCIYISKEENPDLDDSKRAIYGLRKDIYSGAGIYAYEGFWDGSRVSGERAPVEEIQANLRQGYIDAKTPMKYGSRPACYFTADAFYTHALSIRAALIDRNPMNFNSSYNRAIDDLEDLVFANGYLNLPDKSGKLSRVEVKKSDLDYAKVALALNCFMGNWDINSVNTKGLSVRIYGEMLYNGITMLGVSGLSKEEQKSIVAYPTQLDGRLVLGVDQAYNDWRDLNRVKGSAYDNISAVAKIADNISIASDNGYYNRDVFDINSVNVWYLSQLNASDYYSNLFLAVGDVPDNSSEFGNYLPKLWYLDFAAVDNGNPEFVGSILYGYRCINAGYVYLSTFDSVIHELNTMYPLTSGTPHIFLPLGTGIATGSTTYKLINGTSCLGDGCIDHLDWNTVVDYYGGEVLGNVEPQYTAECADTTISSYAAMDARQYRDIEMKMEDAIAILENATLEKFSGALGDYNDTYGGYNNVFKGLHRPLRNSDGTECSHAYATYANHTGSDIINLDDATSGTRVSPVTDGVIVKIVKYPYNVSSARRNSGETSLSFPGGTWPGMGGYGNCVIVLHRDENGRYFTTLYAHLSEFGHISLGSLVNSDTVLGYAGSTGKSTGAHLHLEIRSLGEKDLAGFYINSNCHYTSMQYIAANLEGTFDYAGY